MTTESIRHIRAPTTNARTAEAKAALSESNRLEPDRDMLNHFAALVFKNAKRDGVVSLRAFREDADDTRSIFVDPIRINDPDFLNVVVERARQAATWDKPAVFCPPVATFKNHQNAKGVSIAEGVCLSVECDSNPREARQTLEALLGAATAVAESGGEWTNPQTGEIERKVHLHWRLKETTKNEAGHKLLYEARDLATRLVGGDMSNKAIVHPIRWPGSWHRKGEPRMAMLIACNDDAEIDLDEAVAILRKAAAERPDARTTITNHSHQSTQGATPDDNGVDAFREAGLPRDLMDLVFHGVEIGKRSDQFFHAVKWLKDLDWSPGDITTLLMQYPEGIAAKYAAGHRVEEQVGRAYGKPDQAKSDHHKPDDAKDATKLILSSKEFTEDFVPPDYLLDGVLLRGFVYSLTARTGDGKTALMLLLASVVAQSNKKFAGQDVAQGRVLYFAGENPDDVRMRWIAMAQHLNFDADTIDVYFIPGTFDIARQLELRIRQEVDAINGVTLIVIDTSPAYFQGESENDTVDMIAHAEMLRRLRDLPGNPTVIAACHPVKNAGNDALIPRGGGAFLNAMDGNLCAHKTDMLVTLHHQGKFRGVDFEPMSFELMSVTARKLLDSRKRHIPTVIARDLSRDEQDARTSQVRSDQDAVLLMLFDRGVTTSFNEIAKGLRWFTGKDTPNKSKVRRTVDELKAGRTASHLVETDRDGVKLTKKGKETATRLATVRDDER